jgi:hypothetical protein
MEIPQGSCCGPGFWNVLYNLLNMKYSSHTKLTAFADDLAILTYGKTVPEAKVYVNSDLAKIEKWAWNKTKFNKPKSKAMIKTNKRRRDKINIILNDRRLKQVDVMKYLGIHFDSRLLFYKHTEQVVEKSRTLTYMLNRTTKLHWVLGTNPSKWYTREP